MKVIIIRSWVGLFLCLVLSAIASAQDMEIDTRYKTADTNNAVIEGRVNLPSGFSAERNVRIILRNSQMVLSTRYSDKHGEFRFDLPDSVFRHRQVVLAQNREIGVLSLVKRSQVAVVKREIRCAFRV